MPHVMDEISDLKKSYNEKIKKRIEASVKKKQVYIFYLHQGDLVFV